MIEKNQINLVFFNVNSFLFRFVLKTIGSFSSLSCSRFCLFYSRSVISCLSDLGRLLLVYVGALVLSLIATVIVPSTLSSVVVVSQDECIDGGSVALSVFNVGDAVEFFADSALHDDILLVLVILSISLEVQLVVVGVRHDDLGLFHVHTDW